MRALQDVSNSKCIQRLIEMLHERTIILTYSIYCLRSRVTVSPMAVFAERGEEVTIYEGGQYLHLPHRSRCGSCLILHLQPGIC